MHRRTAWLRDEGYLVLLDELLGSGAHTVQANYQFAAGLLEPDGPAAVLFNRRFELAWACTGDVNPVLMSGGADPRGGWIAQSLGVREAAPRLGLEFKYSGAYAALLTIVADRQRGAGIGRRVTTDRSGEALTACVRGRTSEDVLIAGRQPHERFLIDTDAPLAVLRMRDGAAIDEARVGGSYARLRNAAAADSQMHAGTQGRR